MRMIKPALLFLTLFLFIGQAEVQAKSYGHRLCLASKDFDCYKVKRRDSWHRLFPNAEQRDIAMRVNRMNTGVYPGLTIAIPKNIKETTIYDVAPFPRYIDATGEKSIYINESELAWGAYDAEGELVWWGPVSTGKDWCPDIDESCKTPKGNFRVIRKQGADCISSAFPKRWDGDDGGAPMPYCMHFHRGFALHASASVPGRSDSHGCIRMFYEDARWLNTQFINLPKKSGGKGTQVIVF